jgi:hypothetical protein
LPYTGLELSAVDEFVRYRQSDAGSARTVYGNVYRRSDAVGQYVKKQKFIGGYRKRSTRMGMLTAVAFSSLCFMLLTSLPFVRARLHSFFRVCHFIGEHGLVDSRLRFSIHCSRDDTVVSRRLVLELTDPRDPCRAWHVDRQPSSETAKA